MAKPALKPTTEATSEDRLTELDRLIEAAALVLETTREKVLDSILGRLKNVVRAHVINEIHIAETEAAQPKSDPFGCSIGDASVVVPDDDDANQRANQRWADGRYADAGRNSHNG